MYSMYGTFVFCHVRNNKHMLLFFELEGEFVAAERER